MATFFADYPLRTYVKDEVIVRPGENTKAMYIVSGAVAQYDISKSGDKLVVNLYKPGAFLSIATTLTDMPEEFFFEATEPVVVHVAPKKELAKFLAENSDVALDALARISRGSSGLMLRLARVMEGSAEGRIMLELEIMKARFAGKDAGVAITEARLAAQTGLARETVSRALKRLKSSGAITAERGRIFLSN